MMNKKYNNIFFFFHSTSEHLKKIQSLLSKVNLKNCSAISDELIKSQILKKSFFAVAKSGAISLEICNANVPSIIIYKLNFINYFIIKLLVKVKFANIINIAADHEIIPELLQSKCNEKNIFNNVDKLLNNKNLMNKQILDFQHQISKFQNKEGSKLASSILINHL